VPIEVTKTSQLSLIAQLYQGEKGPYHVDTLQSLVTAELVMMSGSWPALTEKGKRLFEAWVEAGRELLKNV